MTHAELVDIAAKWLRRQGCRVVLTERGTHEIPDAIGWGKTTIVVEVKVSRSDFFADMRKPHRSGPQAFGRERWYLTPTGLLERNSIPCPWGLLEWDGRIVRRVLKPTPLDPCLESVEHERRLLLSELAIYHAQGIRYLTISEQQRTLPAEGREE